MPRNTEGLKRSARLRTEAALARATAAFQRMEATDQEINFRTVASEARVSTAWLYGQQEFRGRIIRLRKTQTLKESTPFVRNRQWLSRQNIMKTLRLRIKTLEEKNRELTEKLERAYGVICQT